jgi:hypothetical protein
MPSKLFSTTLCLKHYMSIESTSICLVLLLRLMFILKTAIGQTY